MYRLVNYIILINLAIISLILYDYYGDIMIELELKYKISTLPSSFKKLKIVKEKDQKDIYYDTPNYDLIRTGNFLRIRNNNRLEFKLFAGDTSHLFCRETDFDLDKINDNSSQINEILCSLSLNSEKFLTDFKQIIELNDLTVLAPIIKHRVTYQFDDISTISIDEVEGLGLFMEAEIMVDEEKISIAKANKIKKQFIDKLTDSKILGGSEEIVKIGYVELYLLNNNKKAYDLGMFKG